MTPEMERQLMEMGIIPSTPLEEIGVVAVTGDSYDNLPSYNEETQEYMF